MRRSYVVRGFGVAWDPDRCSFLLSLRPKVMGSRKGGLNSEIGQVSPQDLKHNFSLLTGPLSGLNELRCLR